MNDKALCDLSNRMHNDFYVGVVGSVRSGKSSFINQFFKLKVLPYVNDDFLKHKILDELPQCSEGKQIMTVEPKFIPAASLNINVKDDFNLNIRLVDCVGSIIPSATGYESEDGPRLVKTPWFDEPIPFEDAAKIGTEKVIYNHSNLGIYVTADGSFGEFTRIEYQEVEEKLIPKIIETNKPFVIILNSKDPHSSSAKGIANELSQKYNVSCIPVNIPLMTEEELDEILSAALNEFPIEELEIALPDYLEVLGDDVEFKKQITDCITNVRNTYVKLKDVKLMQEEFKNSNLFTEVTIELFNPGDGLAQLKLNVDESHYQEIVNDLLGQNIDTKADFINYLYKCKKATKMYETIGGALEMAKETGYGISVPDVTEMKLMPPSLVKQNGKFGVKLSAIAPSIHLIKVDVESSFTPIIGSETQSQLLIENLMSETENSDTVWDKEFFGRKLSEIVNDGIKSKIYQMPEKSKDKLKGVLDKILNSNHNGLIAIII